MLTGWMTVTYVQKHDKEIRLINTTTVLPSICSVGQPTASISVSAVVRSVPLKRPDGHDGKTGP